MKKILIIACLFLMSIALSAVIALHEPPQAYLVGEEVTLRLDVIEGLETITRITLHFKPTEAQDYSRRIMNVQAPGSNLYFSELKPKDLGQKDIQYYFEFDLGNGQLQRYPEILEGGMPFALKAEHQSGREEQGFVLLSTQDDFPQEDGYTLVVSYMGIADQIELQSIEVWVDGKNVTRKAVITENTLVYRDKRPRDGSYQAIITALTKKGEKIKSPSFITKVTPKRGRINTNFAGNLNFIANVYDHTNLSGAVPPGYEYPRDEYATWLDLYSRLGKLKLNANIYYSSQEEENQQLINRYRVGFDTPLLTIQAGDYSPHLSPLVMSNKNNRGLYGRLSGKYIGLELTAGEMVRQTVAEESDTGNSYTTFKQEALGGRLRLGSDSGLSMSFNVIRNRDIISSLSEEQFIRYHPVTADTLFIVAPQDNMVVSVDTKINIPGLRTYLGLEVAGSLLNRNTWYGPISAEEIAQYIDGFDYVDPADFAEIFVINKNMEPLLPGISNLAANAYFRSIILNNHINVNASMTGSVYNALSTWNQEQDTQVISITDMLNIGKFLFLSGGYTLLRDNFSQTATETNQYNTWFVQSSLRLFKTINFKAGYFNSDAANEINPEILWTNFVPYQRNANSLTLGLGYYAPNNYLVPYQMDVIYRIGEDTNEDSSMISGSYANSSSSISLSLTNKLKQIPLRLQLVFSLATQNNDRDGYSADPVTNNSLNAFAKASYPLFNEKLNPYLQYRSVILSGDQNAQSYGYLTLGLEAYLLKSLSINTDLRHQTYKNHDVTGQNRSTLSWHLTLGQRF